MTRPEPQSREPSRGRVPIPEAPLRSSVIDEIDLRHMGRVLWRWRLLIAFVTFCFALLSVVIVESLTPVYTATNQVAIGPQQLPLLKLDELVAELKGDNESIATEIAIIRSRKLMRKTVLKLGLDAIPEFNPAPSLKVRIVEFVRERSLLAWIEPRLSPDESKEPRVDRRLNELIDMVLDRLKVTSDGKSRVITLAFTSTSAELATEVVNTIADFYITAQLDAKLEAAKRANLWLADQLAIFRKDVLASEDSVEQFRRNHNLLRGQTSTITSQEISQAATEAVAAHTKLLEAQSRLIQVQQSDLARGRFNGDPATLPEVLQSAVIQTLRVQEVDASRRLADLLARYGDKHPSVINLRAELADIGRHIQAEVTKVTAALRNEVANQQAREASLNALLEKLKAEQSRSNIDEVRLHELEREAQANNRLYESLLQRFKETQSQQNFQMADAEIISSAAIPMAPSFPQKTVVVLLSVITGLAVGVLLALIWENMDVGLRSMEQVTELLHLNPLGMVPSLGLAAVRRRPEREVLDRPISAYSEALRTIQANILLSDVDIRARTILVTSSLPGEGKSSTALSLARLMARDGERVLLIDCDLRRPAVHKMCGLDSGPGLADWLVDKSKLDDIVHLDHDSAVNVITAGHLPSVPSNLLGSHRFQQLLRHMREQHDVILLDSAPILAIADTRVLSALADKTVVVVRWASTPRKVAVASVEQLRRAGANIAGAVLSMVDVRSHAKDGFSDSVLYSGRLKYYYH